MKTYQEMTLAERQAEYAALCRTHQEQKALGLDLNMARGKPGREQLDMVMEMYNIPLTADDFITDGIDARNYGYVAGIPIARRLFADLLGCKPGQVIAGGNSSLSRYGRQRLQSLIRFCTSDALGTCPGCTRW